MQGQQYVKFKIPSDYIYVGPIRAFVKQLAQRLEFSQMKSEDIELTVDEMCSNAIEHGSCGINSDILLALMVNDDCLEILVRDQGKTGETVSWLQTWLPEEIEEKISTESERGRGILLVKLLSDRLDIKPNSQGGTDVLTVFLRRTASSEVPDCQDKHLILL